MSRADTPAAPSPSPGYHRVTTADGVEFRLDPLAVQSARRLSAVAIPTLLLMFACPALIFVGAVGYALVWRWWGALPGVALAVVLVVVGVPRASRSASRWADREGRKVLVVAPDGRIALDGKTVVRRGRARGVSVRRVEWQEEERNVHFQVVVDTADGPVLLPVPENGQWSVRAHYLFDWLLGFDVKEDADRFADEIADALRLSRS